MTQMEVVAKIAEKVGITKVQAKAAVETFESALLESISEGGSYRFSGLGTMSKTIRAARKGRNPQTGEEIDIPATAKVKFKTTKNFK